MSNQQRESWHLDRRVPLALIIAIIAQTAAAIWWAAGIDASDARQNERIAYYDKLIDARIIQFEIVNTRLTKLEVRLDGITESLNRIERSLNQRNGRSDGPESMLDRTIPDSVMR